jgi:hypothetical protein
MLLSGTFARMICIPCRISKAHDPTATAVQVAHDVAHVVVGSQDFDEHDGFQEHRSGLMASFLHASETGDEEGLLRRVDFMVEP